MSNICIETVTGKLVDLNNPQSDSIAVEDIAWALSRMPRFIGHTITSIPYNNAQHSIYVAKIVKSILHGEYEPIKVIPNDIAQAAANITMSNLVYSTVTYALFHDGGEAYTGDIPSPVKKIPEFRPIIKSIEAKLDAAMFTALGIPQPNEDQIKLVKFGDQIAQAVEGYIFMPSRGSNWGLPAPSLSMIQTFPEPKDSFASFNEFIEFYRNLE